MNKQFSAALNRWMDGRPISLRRLAALAGVSDSELSKVSTGKKEITLSTLSKLLPAIAEASTRAHARALLVAYLHDETPPTWEPDVSITATGADEAPASDPLADLAARWLAKARSNPKFAQLWILEDSFMHGDPKPAAGAGKPASSAANARPQGTTRRTARRAPNAQIVPLPETPPALPSETRQAG